MQFDRKRRGMFDDSAQDYESYRPAYPGGVFDRIVFKASLTKHSRILEVGSGTGKASLPLAGRGFPIDCIEPGKNLNQIAAAKLASFSGIKIFSCRFEDFRPLPAGYDLLFSAQAFHWIEQELRLYLAARALKPGASLALIYNYTRLPSRAEHVRLSRKLFELSENKMQLSWDFTKAVGYWQEQLRESLFFDDLSLEIFPWQRTCSTQEYLGLFNTFSDFISLGDRLKYRIRNAITEALAETENRITLGYDCILYHTLRNKNPTGTDTPQVPLP